MEPIAYERAVYAPPIQRRGVLSPEELLLAKGLDLVKLDLGENTSLALLPNDWPDGASVVLGLESTSHTLTFDGWGTGDDKAEKNIRIPSDVAAPVLSELGHVVCFRWSGEEKLWTLESANFFTQDIEAALTGGTFGIGDITGLQVALDGKAGTGHGSDHESGGADPISHDSLLDYDIGQHREINDGGNGTTDLLSASKILSLISGVSAGLDYKNPVVTTTEGEGAISLSGDPGTLNGVDVQDGDRVAVVDQGGGGLGEHADNGIWTVDYGGAWARAADADVDAEVTNGMTFFVHDPNSDHYREFYMLTTSGVITLGVTALAFAKMPYIAFGDGAGQAVEGTTPRLPTQDENDALAGSSGTGVSAANRLVDNADTATAKANNKVPRADGSGLLDPNWLALLSNFNGGNQLVQLDGDSALPSGRVPWATTTETGSGTPPEYVVQAGDYGKTLIVTNALTVYVTIPDGLPSGFWCRVMQGGAGKVVTQGNGTSSVVGVSAQGDDLVATRGSLYSVIEILPTAVTDQYVVTGDTSVPPFSNVWSTDFGGHGNDAVATTDGALTAMHGASEMTWGMWVKGSFGGSSGATSYFWHGGSYYILQGQLGGSVAGNFRVHFGTVWNAGNFVADVYNNSWNFLTVTLSAQVYQFYINGILKATSGAIGPSSLPSAGFATGAEIGNEGVGKYDQFCFWDKALTTDDIDYLVNNNEGAVSPAVDGVSAHGSYDKSANLQYLWRMGDNDGGAGSTITGAIGGVNLSLGGTTPPTFSTDVP